MKRKLIFLDIDGTLVSFGSKLSPLAAAAVRGAQAMGHGVFLCTGRNMPIIQKELLALGFDGIVASAGSYIEVGGEILLDDPMPEVLVQECLDVFHRSGIYCCIETREGTYVDEKMAELLERSSFPAANSELRRLMEARRSKLRMRPYEEYPRQGAYKICFTSPDLPSTAEAERVLGDRFDLVVHPFGDQSVCYNGEIIRKDADKGLAVERVCRHLGVDIADSIAFGDSMNDYAMLRRAGTGVAMGNACQELKDACGAVCGDVDHDGVYHELVRRGLCAPV
ncbi:MAG: HAD family hydrolase [Oscillospiraceae bacterium]|nr:HAD family hydrolase [Oscillospiraceae bacterium]